MLKELTPMKAIRMRRYECAGSAREITLFPVTGCPLYAFRSGHRPKEKPLYETGRESHAPKHQIKNNA